MAVQSNNARSSFSHPAIADGSLAAILLLGLPLWVGFIGQLAALTNAGYRFPAQAITAAVLYAVGVHLALSAWRTSSVGSRLASAFSLAVALLLPLLLRTLLA